MIRGLLVLTLAGATLVAIPCRELRAATSSTIDILPDDRPPPAAESVDVGSLKPLARPMPEPVRAPPSGNPLWAVPLSALTATQTRPIFTASRRPPQVAAVAPAPELPPAPPPAPA